MIRKRSKSTYEITIDTGRNLNGKRLRHYERVKGSIKEARAREAEIKAELNNGAYIINNNITVKSFFEKWMKEYVQQNLKPKTAESYYMICHEFIDMLGNIKLKSLSALNLLEFYNHLRNRNNNQKEMQNKNKRLSENTVLRYYAIINVALNHAVRWQFIANNPNKRLDKPRKVKKESKYYDLEQTIALLRALDDEPIKHQAIIRLALDTGCRRGELTGLEWEDINFETGMVSINKTTQIINNVIREDTPKNNSSIRKVRISTPTIDVLKEYNTYHEKIKESMGDKWLGSKKVFTTNEGDYMHTDTPRTTFKKFLEKYDLPIINFHGLRHTSASLQLSKGISIVDISKRLGHSETSTTLNIYSHAFNSGSDRIVNEFNNIFNTKEG